MKKEPKTNYYEVSVKCSNNCGFGYPYDEYMQVPKGIKEKNWSNITECPTCGCKGTLFFYGN